MRCLELMNPETVGVINDGDRDSEVATWVGTDGIQSYDEFEMFRASRLKKSGERRIAR